MKKDEYANQPWFRPIKGAQRDLIRDVGGLDRAALLLGRSVGQVGRYNNWHDPDLMSQWEIIVLESDLGRPVVSRTMAVLTGASVLDPAGEARGRDCLHSGSAKLMGQYAEFMAVYSEAASDGQFSDREILEILPEAEDVRRSADAFVQKLHRRLAKSAPNGVDE